MIHISFENEAGRLVLSGGREAVFRTLSVAGLGLPTKEFNVTSYAGQRGQETLSEVDRLRVITVSGDASRALQKELSRMTRILYYPGVLKIQSGNKRRRIACRCTSLDDPERIGPFAKFVIQFTCDDPLFNDFEDTAEPVYERKNHLYGNIANSAWGTNGKLAFSTRLSGADLLNKGDSPCEPVFTVTNNEPLAWPDGTGLRIKNVTTGQKLELEYPLAKGESVTLDMRERRITSSNGDNLINFISKETFLSDFALARGMNRIETENYAYASSTAVSQKKMLVECRFNNNYIEAVY